MNEYKGNPKGLYDFVEDTLVDNFLKLARVNLLTGEYEFLKRDSALEEPGYENIPDMYSYIRKQVADGLIYPEHISDYLKYADSGYVRERVSSGERRIVQSYKRKMGEQGVWITFGIVVPGNYSPENPWAVFTWREADMDTIVMVDALHTLSRIYYKILKINLTADSFEGIKVEESEQEQFVKKLTRISDWWRCFAETGNVYEEDVEGYLQFTDLDTLRKYFREGGESLSCRYRRKIGKEYRWVQMDLIPGIEYTNQNQVLILYVKDVHEQYLMEMHNMQELVDNYSRDALTLLYNRHKFNEDLEKMRNGGIQRLTCMYADVNGLHELNNKLGHQKGDNMLCCVADTLRKYFPEEHLYRIGGDEFVMLSVRLSKGIVEKLVHQVRRDLQKENYAISIGIESGMREPAVHKIVGAAELAMREDKERYYNSDSDRRKKRGINEELEKLLTEKKDAEYFIKAVSASFSGVYIVNLKLDTTRYIYIPDYFRDILQDTDFSYGPALSRYVDKFVKEEYQEHFNQLLDYDFLEKELERDGSVAFSFQKIDGKWMNLYILKMEGQGEKEGETIWIFSEEFFKLFS